MTHLFKKMCRVSVAMAVCLLCGSAVKVQAQTDSSELPSWSQVRTTVESHFYKLPDFQPGDLITSADAAPALRALEQMGWKDVSKSEVAKRLLDEGSFLPRELCSERGRLFMRRVSRYELIYDRLDRISQETGGQRLIHDMIRLPDGHRYAAMNPPRGVPPMVDFLPKGVSGKAPQVRDLAKPTGRIYTLNQLIAGLEVSYRQALAAPR